MSVTPVHIHFVSRLIDLFQPSSISQELSQHHTRKFTMEETEEMDDEID
jgi:hypothetical protein